MKKGIKIAQYLCILPGAFLIVSGLTVLFFPTVACAIFDLNNVEAIKEPTSMAMGIRQVAIGGMITVLALSKQPKALGYIMLIGSIVPLSDFFIYHSLIGWISSLRHLAPVPIILGLGIYLLYSSNRITRNT